MDYQLLWDSIKLYAPSIIFVWSGPLVFWLAMTWPDKEDDIKPEAIEPKWIP